jgi:hypothetical protein
MRMVGGVSVFAILVACLAALCYMTYLGPGSSSQKKPAVATVIEMQSSIPEQYPSVHDLRHNDAVGPKRSLPIDNAIKRTPRDAPSISPEEPFAMTANERKMLMYAIKTIDEPSPGHNLLTTKAAIGPANDPSFGTTFTDRRNDFLKRLDGPAGRVPVAGAQLGPKRNWANQGQER